MNLTVFKSNGRVFTNCECISGFSYKMDATRDNYVHFDNEPNLSQLKYAS